MVTFRFHLLSLTAVFLALAVGVAVGATVVDRATVDALRTQLQRVEKRVKATDTRNSELGKDVNEWKRFADQSGDELVEGRLEGVRVLVVGVRGIDTTAVERFRQSMVRAGAVLEGTMWFTSKLKLDKADDVTALAQILGVPNGRPDELRRAMLNRLSSSWAGSGEANPLPALVRDAFVDFENPTNLDVDPSSVPRPESRFVIAADLNADVPNEVLSVPFATALAKSFPARVLAVESDGAVFVGPLRQNEQAAAQLSTVDNLADFRGRMAAVLAMQDLTRGKVGQYGNETRASRLVPEPATP
jgi:hypothetical protein